MISHPPVATAGFASLLCPTLLAAPSAAHHHKAPLVAVERAAQTSPCWQPCWLGHVHDKAGPASLLRRSPDRHQDYAQPSGGQGTPSSGSDYGHHSGSPASQRAPPSLAGASSLRPPALSRRTGFEGRRQENGGAAPAAPRHLVNFASPNGFASAMSPRPRICCISVREVQLWRQSI